MEEQFKFLFSDILPPARSKQENVTMKAQKTLRGFLFLFLGTVVLFLVACGGASRSAGGGFVPTPPPPPPEEPEPPPPMPTFDDVPWPVDPAMARTLMEGSELDMTPEAIRASVVERHQDSTSGTGRGGTFGEVPGEVPGEFLGVDFVDLDFNNFEYQAVMVDYDFDTEVPLAQWRGQGQIGDVTTDVLGYGGWLEHTLFAVMGEVTRGEDGMVAGGQIDSLVFGSPTATNPTSGSGLWTGVMVGVDVSDTDALGNAIQGEAEITIRDFLNPTVDVGFSNVFDLAAGTSRLDMSWQDIPLTSGEFHLSEANNDWIDGYFYGPNHEEVGGIFNRNLIRGAYGAKRHPPMPTFDDVPWPVDPAMARTLMEGTELDMIPEAVRARVAERSGASTGYGGSFGEGLPGGLGSSGLDHFIDSEHQAVMVDHVGDTDVPLAQWRGQGQSGDATTDVFSYGGWLEHTFFAVWGEVTRGEDGRIAGSEIGSSVYGSWTGTNPTSGSGRWTGVMVGLDVSDTDARGNVIQGEAEITISDFLNPTVGVGFSNVFDLAAGTSRLDMS